MHFDSLNIQLNIISELFRVVKKSKCPISNCTAAMFLSSIAIIITKQSTLSVMWPFELSPALHYKWSTVTMHLSCTIMEIWHLKDNGVTTLTFWSHVTSSVTWPFDSRWVTSYGWSIVTMGLSCTVMEIWGLKSWTDSLNTDGRSGDFILCPMHRTWHWTDKNSKNMSTILSSLASATSEM